MVLFTSVFKGHVSTGWEQECRPRVTDVTVRTVKDTENKVLECMQMNCRKTAPSPEANQLVLDMGAWLP